VNLGDTFNNFADTAAAIENLDLVVSIDTSVIHVAGALGKKTWALMPFYADWRFFTETEDVMWYESMKLYRQCEPGNWQDAIDRVYEDLKLLESKMIGEYRRKLEEVKNRLVKLKDCL